MEHTQTKHLWGILHQNHIELLSTRDLNQWSLELLTYNITFKWILHAQNKAAGCLSQLVDIPRDDVAATNIFINSVTASPANIATTHTQSKTKASMEAMTPDTTKVHAPLPLAGDHKDTLLQMQRTNVFCKCISK